MEEKIIEQGTYKMIAKGNEEIRIPDLELTSEEGEKKIWKLKELRGKEVVFEINE